MDIKKLITILVVEDEGLIAQETRRILEDFGYKVLLASSGEESIQIISTNSNINLVLMEMDLGKGLDGAESARQILSLREIPVIFYSNHFEEEYVNRVREISRYGYILKTSGGNILHSSIQMALELFESNQQLKRSEEQYKYLYDNVPIGLFRSTPEGKLLSVNQSLIKMLGYKNNSELLKVSAKDIYLNSDRRKELFITLNEKGSVENFEMQAKQKNGSVIWVNTSIQCTLDNEGNVLFLDGVGVDITDTKKARKEIQNLLNEKEMLLKEVHHRVKNNMNIIKSILSMQSREMKNPKNYSGFQDAISRIESMGILYERLYDSNTYQDVSIKKYFTQLIGEISRIFSNYQSVQIEINIEDFFADSKILFPLGIMLNELITNAMKYAFPVNEKGLIKIIVTKVQKHVVLSFEDNGVGIPDTNNIEQLGFGLTLIEILTKQINGICKVESNNGTKFIIEFDL